MGVGERKSIRLFGVDLFVINNDDNNNNKDEHHEINIGRKRKKIIKRDQVKSSSEARKKKYYGALLLLLPPIPPPLFHPTIVEEMTFLFEKKLEVADVVRGQNRLFITGSEELIMGFLNEEERIKVEEKGQKLVVRSTDKMGRQYTMHLTKWHSLPTITVLNHDWFKFVKANGLKEEDCVQGWGFRRTDNLFRLALHFINN